jgi:hypothetical protein
MYRMVGCYAGISGYCSLAWCYAFRHMDSTAYVDLKRTQDTQLVIIEDKWRDDYKVRVYKEDDKSSS